MRTLEAPGSTKTLLACTFYVKEALCAIDTAGVQEVIRIDRITRVHHAPDEVIGIINLRGKIVTIIDLGQKLDLGRIGITEESRVFIVEQAGEFVGLLADRVSEVVEIQRDRMSPPPPNVRGVQERFIDGVFQAEDHLIAVLSTERILSEAKT